MTDNYLGRQPPSAIPQTPHFAASAQVKVLFVVEGIHDIHFLRRISGILNEGNPQLPKLGALEQAGELIFVPTGGGRSCGLG